MIMVACAIMRNEEGKYLLVQRAEHMAHPLQWEFPGGKLEVGESPNEAIKREVKEELNLDVLPMAQLSALEWEYPGKKVGLIPIICELRLSDIRLREHHNYGWFSFKELEQLDLLAADRVILNQLK